MPNQKKKTWKAMSKYCRLRDALEYCEKHGIDLGQFIRPEDIIGQCCTCGAVKSWIRMDAGHFKGRGSGGSSGTYFYETNVHLQCKQCNAFGGGKPKEYEQFIIEKYGQETLDTLERQHLLPRNDKDLVGLEMYFKQKYKELLGD